MFSEQHNIVESDDWLNLISENGLDGAPKGRPAPWTSIKEYNKSDIAIERLKDRNHNNNPSRSKSQREIHSVSMSRTNNIMILNGTHPMLKESNIIACSERMKITMKNQPVLYCPYCDVSSNNKGNMNRWHFDNCKFKM